MRQRKKRTKPPNREKPYVNPPEWKKSQRTYLRDERLRPYLELMRDSLDTRILTTKAITPSYESFSGQKIRSNEDTNPLWFQRLCELYIVDRKGYKGKRKRMREPKFYDTKIQAIQIQTALDNLIRNGYSHSVYAEDFFRIATTLYEQEKKANQLSGEEESEEVIQTECSELMDLSDLPYIDFGTEENLESSTEDDFDDEIPF